MDEERRSEESRSKVETEKGYDLGTFNFLKAGWWVWHIIAIAGVFYLGYILGESIF
ncbi:hypothetical protein ASZ90_018083 [hydrocarbon metagenome]|uniref:Uncharacterized protein n=1 Tax=hydrocarbon metagenome TaxID=938273 RepID=A0A0W8E7A8_9ZZZZ